MGLGLAYAGTQKAEVQVGILSVQYTMLWQPMCIPAD